MPIVAEYIWIDGVNLRSKIKVIKNESDITKWNFDGSSTGQSETKNSDLILNPIDKISNPLLPNNIDGFIVLCEVLNQDGTPHETNFYTKLQENKFSSDINTWFGFEQEYILLNKDKSLYGVPFENNNKQYKKNNKLQTKQYYCSVGASNSFGRQIADEHLYACIKAELAICGTNSEVTPAQWEFQIGPSSAISASNDLWFARYLLIKIAEKYNVDVTFHPKPIPELNGSGLHTNFSTLEMRYDCNLLNIKDAVTKLSLTHNEHIKVYGKDNHLRLTGKNETAPIDKFSYGLCDRSSSIRIPVNVKSDGKGYIEDRRPAANADPYQVSLAILNTVCDTQTFV
jgi:glutamine synthetase